MPLTEAEKAKGRRAQRLLYAIMALFIALPFVLFWIFR